jgi:hypothetical protein
MIGENRVFLSNFGRTSVLEAVRPLCHDEPYVRYDVFQGEPHFLSTVRLFSDSKGQQKLPKAKGVK